MELRGRKILIVGFGKSGQAAARYCLKQGAIVTVTDEKPAEEFKWTADSEQWAGKTYFGEHPLHLFEKADIIVVSPGVSLNIRGLQLARKKGIPIIGEMELILNEIKTPVIAITGTNGKSTVTTLIGEMLREGGKKVLVGGNLGTPLLELLYPDLSAPSAVHCSLITDYLVLEVSSYQLEITPSFKPYIGILLNITPDHLDRYASYQDYIDAKGLIIKNQDQNDFFVFNKDDENAVIISKKSKSKRIGFSVKEPPVEIDLSKAKITGIHNQENIIAASIAANIAGVSWKAIQKTIDTFKGLAHRNQFVREVRGVKFYDDSKGTNVGAVVKSLEGFDSKVILIAGGLDKGGSYDPLRPLVKEKVKSLVLIGAAQKIIANVLGDLTDVVMADSMAAAVREASVRAVSGDIVLLSPECASFDMFKDYADRGNKFAEEVMKL